MISFVVAMDKQGVIGKDNKLPWYLPADLKHFKETTIDSPIVMGRKTFESIGKPLPKRTNVILTKDENYTAEGCEIIHSPEDVHNYGDDHGEVFVIGGAKVFEELFPEAEKLYLTIIDEKFDGDTYFPEWNEEEWKLIEEKEGTVDEKNKYPHRFLTYKRKG
ncbi:dihydrofolate reductase [Thalassobacillus sp. C254]|uniref:dihydrofolate reductase n=1 Tax=Thalassobacillus sp. C254 TaxID=1225341 RepID=UPI0006D15C71|nr:dihydrofolate reductase [Thalassobacillus sp. C254]